MKKYSDKFLNQTFKLKDAVVGIEFEFYMKDISYYKTLELLNQYLSPVKVWGFRQYHSTFTPDSKNFKIEPDLSGGSNMVELITGPLPYFDAKYYLVKIIKFIQDYGYTNEKCSIHFNVSFNDEEMQLSELNLLKFILNVDEDEIYRSYPSRKGNIYAKSIKKIIPFREYDYFNIPISVVKNNIRLPNDKYYGVNFMHINEKRDNQRIEFRYIGGKDYEKNLGQVIYFMERFIINTHDSINANFNNEDVQKLESYLEDNIKNFKTFSNYDDFIVEFPTIQIQIDQVSNYDMVSSYYGKIYRKLFNLVESVDRLRECIINYVTDTQVIEVIDANIKGIATIKTVEFINCELTGIFDDCFLVGCIVNEAQISKSKLKHTDVDDSKILNCHVDASSLKNCYFMEGYLNGDMQGGVFRSGKLGPYATMDADVKVVSSGDNFFDTKFDTVGDKGDSKGIIKSYGKQFLKK